MSNLTQLVNYFRKSQSTKSNLNKWRLWAFKILRRKNFPIDLSICAYGKNQLVDRVKPFGGGSIFWSKACSGCHIGDAIINLYKTDRTEFIPTHKHCLFLESGLLTRDPVKPGDVYILPPFKNEI